MRSLIQISLLITLFTLQISAQKVDIDNTRISISNAKLPANYIPIEKRTYDVVATGEWNNGDIENSINLHGWDRVEENPNVELRIDISPMTRGSSSLKSRVVENKDKNGKVLSTETYYSVTSTNQGNATLTIFGLKNEQPKELSQKEKEKLAKKEKEAKEKEAKEKKAKEPANPFLANVDTKDAGKNDTDKGGSDFPKVYTFDLGQSYTYTTSETKSSSQANNEYRSNAGPAYDKHSRDFVTEAVTRASNYASNYYGYYPVKTLAEFKKLDSEKHPEYTMYNNAMNALNTIFSKMRYNKPIEEIEGDLAPIVKYFEEVEAKYTKDEKQEKRLRGATLYNLAAINHYLDHHDKTIELANKMIALDIESGDAEDILEASIKIKKQLEFHHMKSRHITPKNDADKAENEGVAEEPQEKK